MKIGTFWKKIRQRVWQGSREDKTPTGTLKAFLYVKALPQASFHMSHWKIGEFFGEKNEAETMTREDRTPTETSRLSNNYKPCHSSFLLGKTPTAN